MHAFMRMTTTDQKKMYHHHFFFLTPKYILYYFLGLSAMSTSPILLLYLLMQFMHRNIILNFTRLNIEALSLLYDPIKLFWNYTDVVYRLGIIHNRFNRVGTFWIPLQNFFFCCSPDLNMCLIWLQLLLCNAWWDASHSFPCNTTSQYFFSWYYAALKKSA